MSFFWRKKEAFQGYSEAFKDEIDQLLKMGYYQFQINNILNSAVGRKTNAKNLNVTDKERIRGLLKQQIEFAQKALKANSKKTNSEN